MSLAALSRHRLWLAAFLATFAVIAFGLSQRAVGASASVEPSVVCDVDEAIYGELVACSGTGAESLLWPDDVVTNLEGTRPASFVGEGVVAAIDDDGEVLASTPLTITPDIALECEVWSDEIKQVFELEKTDLRERGWDYIFTDIETGEAVHPGDPRHPNGGAEDGLDRIVLEEAQSTGLCRITSLAVEDLDGEYSLTVESPWEASQSTTARIVGPTSYTRWGGAQPGEVIAVVTVNNMTASERAGVYMSGCT